MAQPLYDLQVDYINQHGHFMVLSSPKGLNQEELSDFQLNMLSVNRIPNLLELQLEAREGNVQLCYKITGKRMLAHWLRIEKLTLLRFYSLLYQIVEVLDDSKNYMLLPGRYILKDEFIYCGNGLEDLYLTYVPKEHLEGKAAIAADLQQLVSRWIQKVTELHGRGYQELSSYLLEENFNIPELKQLLLKHMRELSPVQMTAERAAAPSLTVTETPSVIQPSESKRMLKTDEGAMAGLFRMEAGFSAASDMALPAMQDPAASDVDKTVRDGRRKQMLIVLMAVLGCCLIWKLYAESPGEKLLYGSAAATAVVCFAAAVLIKKTRVTPSSAAIVYESEPYETLANNGQAEGGYLSQIGLGGSAPEPESDHRSEEVMRTTLLKTSDATVFLGRAGMQTAASISSAYLEVMRNGIREKVPLSKSSFMIGRAGGGSDWVQEEAGVSRLHAEIVKEEETFVIKDLGSRNGTAVNGEMLPPYRVHVLKDGDVVKIITTEYTFKMGF